MNITPVMLHKVQPGMVIAEDVYKGNQLVVLRGTIIDDDVMKLLRSTSVISISIYDRTEEEKPKPKKENPNATYSERIRSSEAFQKFEKGFESATNDFSCKLNDIAAKSDAVNIDELFSSANEVMAGTSNTHQLMEFLSNIRYFDDITYAHSLNVALLANILGRWLHFNEDTLKLLTVAGMLHDIGKLNIPPELIKKPGRLTSEEFAIIKQHPVQGYQILKSKKVDENIAQAALLHHEKCDGSGYPYGLKGERINNLAKLITIVDIYEAMTANRSYHKGICPFAVIKMYEDEGYAKYDPAYLVPFLQGISDTYLHNHVLLNDGRQGEVILTNKSAISRPGIMVGKDFVDLTRHPELNIIAIL